MASDERERRLELKWQHVHRRALRRAELPECIHAGGACVQMMHPAPRGDAAEARRATDGYRSIEGREQPAPADGSIPGARQAEQREVGKLGCFLHNPSLAAHGHAIAGRKGHACPEATRIPGKNYRNCPCF